MIKAVFFDWYNTIARFHPPREEQQVEACCRLGVEVSLEARERGDELISTLKEAVDGGESRL